MRSRTSLGLNCMCREVCGERVLTGVDLDVSGAQSQSVLEFEDPRKKLPKIRTKWRRFSIRLAERSLNAT
jgi:hypothetical protein